MAELKWDQTGEKTYESGVDRGVLFVRDNTGAYPEGVVWNGLTTVTESPSGAEANKQYADNIPYVNLRSAEEFGITIEAFTSPVEFDECDGSASPVDGLSVTQQSRKPFGFSWRTNVGNDIEGQNWGYKLHLGYGLTASPSEKARSTVNDSPEALSLSWECTSDPVDVPDLRPSAHLILDSTVLTAAQLKAVEDVLYGRGTGAGSGPRLPLPEEVISLLSAAGTQSLVGGSSSSSSSGSSTPAP